MKIPSGPKRTASSDSGDNHKSVSSNEVLERNQAARKNSRPLLDPHGIYGTRSAYRIRAAERRRRVQTLGALGVVAAIGVFTAMWMRDRRVPTLKPLVRVALPALPSGFPVWAAPVGAPGAASTAQLLIPTESGSLLPVDILTGRPSPTFKAAFAIRSQPLVVGAVAYVPCEDGTLFAIDWRNGQQIWSYRSGTSILARPGYAGIAAGSSQDEPGTAKPKVLPVVIMGDDDGNVAALLATSGKLIWKQSLHAPVGNSIAVAEGVTGASASASKVIVPVLPGLSTAGGVQCLDTASGRIVWQADLGAAFLPAPAVQNGSNGRVFCVGDNGSVVCLDLATGRKIWKTFAQPLKPEDAENAVILRAEPLLASYSWGKALICSGNDGGVRCFDAESGRVLWTFDAGAAVLCRPRALQLKDSGGSLQDVILFGSEGSFAYALDAHTGMPLWKCRTTGTAFATPGLQQNTVVCLTREGSVETYAMPD